MGSLSRSVKVSICIGLFVPLVWSATAIAELRIQRDVEFTKRGPKTLKADVYLPSEGDGPFPGVMMVHGGAWMGGRKTDMSMHARRLASKGYAVVSIEYRLAPQHKFPAQIEDCREALVWIRKNAQRFRIDPRRIAGFGYSAGGHLVCLLGLLNSDDESQRLQAVVAGGAPCEFRTIPATSGLLIYWLGGRRSELPNVYRDASPATFASADDPPVFFYHGERDRMVPDRSAKVLHGLLKDKGVRTDMHTVVDAGHIKTFFDQQPVDRAADFLDEVLKPSQPE